MADNDAPLSTWKYLSSKWTVYALLVAVAGWLIAVLIEISEAHPSMNEVSGLVPNVLKNRPTTDFLINLGFSLLIARVVAIVVDREAELRMRAIFRSQEIFFREKLALVLDSENQRFELLSREIARNVFFGVLNLSQEQEYIEEVIRSSFRSSIIRESYDATYWLRSAFYPGENNQKIPCIALEGIFCFDIHNIGSSDQQIPLFLSIPKPEDKEKQEVMAFDYYRVEREAIDQAELRSRIISDIHDEDKTEITVKVCELMLSPGEKRRVDIRYTLFKNEEDNELMRLSVPCRKVRVAVHNENDSVDHLGIRSVHRDEFKPTVQCPNAYFVWELNSFTLPEQGFILWWTRQRHPRRRVVGMANEIERPAARLRP